VVVRVLQLLSHFPYKAKRPLARVAQIDGYSAGERVPYEPPPLMPGEAPHGLHFILSITKNPLFYLHFVQNLSEDKNYTLLTQNFI